MTNYRCLEPAGNAWWADAQAPSLHRCPSTIQRECWARTETNVDRRQLFLLYLSCNSLTSGRAASIQLVSIRAVWITTVYSRASTENEWGKSDASSVLPLQQSLVMFLETTTRECCLSTSPLQYSPILQSDTTRAKISSARIIGQPTKSASAGRCMIWQTVPLPEKAKADFMTLSKRPSTLWRDPTKVY